MNAPEPIPFIAAKPLRPLIPAWCVLTALIVVVIAAFIASVKFGFINYDDPHYVTENPHVNTGLNLPNLKWALTSTGETNLWSPLTFLSHQLDVSLFGLRPAGHHAVNVLWHALATAFLFLTALKLTKSTFWSFFIGILWAIHPEKVQSVAWLSERKDVLSGAFFFASLYAFTWWKLRPQKASILYVASFLLFLCALLAKPSVVPLPLILYLLFYLDFKNIVTSVREATLPLLPFVAAAIVVTAITIHFQSQGTLAGVGDDFTATQRIGNIVVGYVFYLKRFFWPSPAQLWFVPPDSILPLATSVVVLCLLTPLLLWLGKKEKLIIVGATVYTILWLPVSGIVSVSYYFVADRYSYLPQFGLVIMLMGLARLAARSSTSLVPAGLVLGSFTGFLLILQQQQLPLWKDNETLFGYEMTVNPQSLLAPIHYAEVFADSDPEKALSYYTKAHRNDPQAGIALAKMGVMQKQLGRNEEALESFTKATQVTTPLPQAWTQLLVLQVELQLYDQAEETIERGIDSDPDNWDFLMNSGNFYLMVRKQPREALICFLKAHILVPTDQRSIEACAHGHRLLGNDAKARKYESLLDPGR
ncbi:MAG: tetratricopeptide repeat protein [Luteolibacter sp.]